MVAKRNNCRMLIRLSTFLSWSLLAATLSVTSLLSEAKNISHVNVGRIAVDNQSQQSQQRAGREALAQVFVKLSGNQNVLREPEISRAVDNYEQFLISSSFLQQSQTLVFEATFNQAKVESLLLASGLSVWASLRPSGVIWLAIDNDKNQKVMLSQFSAASLSQKLNLKAFARGVDIAMPLGDLEDSMNLSVYDIWNQYISKLQAHSTRYGTDYLISATVQSYDKDQASSDRTESELFFANNVEDLSESPDQIIDVNSAVAPIEDNPSNDNEDLSSISQSRPSQQDLMINTFVPDGTTHKLDYVITHVNPNISKKVETGRVFGESEEAVILQVVDVYANMLAKTFALSSPDRSESETIQVVFNGIDSLQDYVNMMSLIRSVPAVENVRLIKQSSVKAFVEIQQTMSTTQLKSILTLDDRISALPVTSADAEISFRWLER